MVSFSYCLDGGSYVIGTEFGLKFSGSTEKQKGSTNAQFCGLPFETKWLQHQLECKHIKILHSDGFFKLKSVVIVPDIQV